MVLGGVAGATSGILGDAKIRGAAWGVAPRRMRRFRAPQKLAPAGMGHSALHLMDKGERFARAGLPRARRRWHTGCYPSGASLGVSAPPQWESCSRPTRVPQKKTSSSSTIPSLNSDGSGRTESRFRVPTRAPRDGRSLGARLDDGKIPGFQCRPLVMQISPKAVNFSELGEACRRRPGKLLVVGFSNAGR